MNNLEKYLDQVIEQKPIVYEPPAEIQGPPTTNMMESVRKRWSIVSGRGTLAICAVGLPAVWFLVEPALRRVGHGAGPADGSQHSDGRAHRR